MGIHVVHISLIYKAVASYNLLFKKLGITLKLGEIWVRLGSKTMVNLEVTALEST